MPATTTSTNESRLVRVELEEQVRNVGIIPQGVVDIFLEKIKQPEQSL